MNFKKLLSILLLGTVLSFSTITAEEVGQEYELTGGRTNGNGFVVRSYGFTGASVSLFSCKEHGFFAQPMMLNILFGGGFEFQYSVNTAFVVEFGGLNKLLLGNNKSDLEGYAKSNPVLTIGFRTLK